jgi:class 3 adenylate cyclase
MTFVNQIAEITHTCVNRFGGAANKNIGDAFLLVWKFKLDDLGQQVDSVTDENVSK